MMEKFLLPDSPEWRSADKLNDYDKVSIRVTLIIHAIAWLLVTAICAGTFALSIFMRLYNLKFEWYQLALLMVTLMTFWMFMSNILRIRKLKRNDFKWVSATVERVRWGNNHRKATVWTDLGIFYVGQLALRFRRNQEVIVVQYKVGATNKTLGLNLTYLFDPLAYVAQYYND